MANPKIDRRLQAILLQAGAMLGDDPTRPWEGHRVRAERVGGAFVLRTEEGLVIRAYGEPGAPRRVVVGLRSERDEHPLYDAGELIDGTRPRSLELALEDIAERLERSPRPAAAVPRAEHSASPLEPAPR